MDIWIWAENLQNTIQPEIALVFVSILPFIELRGAIPIGILAYKLPVEYVFAVCVITNIGIVPIILFWLNYLLDYFLRVNVIRYFFEISVVRTRKKTENLVKKYGALGLTLFVAIPLPVTGAWTGSLAAFIFGIEQRKAILSIGLGVFIAGTIVTLSTLGIISLF
ncbi:MAG: COG2426 family protein [Candidatus Hydrothermarchaeota archaeon]